jgi:uracil-DNA glycosylase family 4
MPSNRSSPHAGEIEETRIRLLEKTVVACRKCPRLVAFREGVPRRAAFGGQEYWRKPVPGFGDIGGRLLVLGIAPAAHGGNRTGRPFTGDSSGRFLVRALHSNGFANQPVSEYNDDGLTYRDCFVTAAVKCAPPGDRPTPGEFDNCSGYLDTEIALMANLRAILVLGRLSFRACMDHVKRKGGKTRGLSFRHGGVYNFTEGPTIYASYHPSPRNTNTGRLTEGMLVRVIQRIRADFRSRRGSKDN